MEDKRRCSGNRMECLKSNFDKDESSKDNLNPICKSSK